MYLRIKKRIEEEIINYTRNLGTLYGFKKLSPLLSSSIKEFILRKGKRVRPILFCIGYLGFAKKIPYALYRSAISLELLHDFLLIHDDIIDKSQMRRGKLSMHTRYNRLLKERKEIKFCGEDLAMLTGDIFYAMAIDTFLAIKEGRKQKEEALKKLILTTLYTGSGEFIELLLTAKPIEKASKKEIYKVYDYKTANYTFASPLTIGATLAKAKKNQINKLFAYGMNLGRAFQIKDDIIGIFGETSAIGKSNLSDLSEAKKTILIWHAYKHASTKDKGNIRRIFKKDSITKKELILMRKILLKYKSLEYAKNQIQILKYKSEKLLNKIKIKPKYRNTLHKFSEDILKV
ncbi:MAG: polyprenyl synthetase family protein [Candidatus Omnitrophota bacterium]